MKEKLLICILSLALASSVIVNVVLARANLLYVDREYGSLAEQHLINSQIRENLEVSNVEAAKAILDKEIELKGVILAICLMENCSAKAKKTMAAIP